MAGIAASQALVPQWLRQGGCKAYMRPAFYVSGYPEGTADGHYQNLITENPDYRWKSNDAATSFPVVRGVRYRRSEDLNSSYIHQPHEYNSREPFTIALYCVAEDTGGGNSLLQQRDGTGTGRTIISQDGANWRTALSGSVATIANSPDVDHINPVFVCIASDGDVADIYLDGKLCESVTIGDSANVASWQIGNNKTFSSTWNGLIGPIVFYPDRKITPSEVRRLRTFLAKPDQQQTNIVVPAVTEGPETDYDTELGTDLILWADPSINGSYDDLSGNQSTAGVPNGTMSIIDESSANGRKAFGGDGSSDCEVEFPDGTYADEFTASFWCETLDENGAWVACHGNVGSQQAFAITSSGFGGMSFGIRDSNNDSHSFSIADVDNIPGFEQGPYHFVCRFSTSGGWLDVWCNGQRIGYDNHDLIDMRPANHETMICSQRQGVNEIDSWVDSVRIYSKTLSDGAIQKLWEEKRGYDHRNADLATGLVGWYDPSVVMRSRVENWQDVTDAACGRDLSGTGNHGTIHGDCAIEKDDGNWCFNFQGTDGYIELPTGGTLQPDYITLSAWIKPDESANSDWAICCDDGSVNDYGIAFKQSGSYWGVGFALNSSGNRNSGQIASGETPGAQNWGSQADADARSARFDHYCMTYDGIAWRIYINGVLARAGSNALVGGPFSGPISYPGVVSLRIGADSSNYFTGRIDSVRIYDRAVSKSEVKELYDAGRGYDHRTLTPSTIPNGMVLHVDPSIDNATKDLAGQSTITIGNDLPVVYDTHGTHGGTKALEYTETDHRIDTKCPVTVEPVSISVWINPTASGYVVCKGDPTNFNEDWRLDYIHTGRLNFTVDTDGSSCNIVTGFNRLVADDWNHVVLTWDGTTDMTNGARVYVNGVSESLTFTDGTGNVADQHSDLIIGNRGDNNATRAFDGKIDSLIMHNRVLTQAEVTELYDNGRGYDYRDTFVLPSAPTPPDPEYVWSASLGLESQGDLLLTNLGKAGTADLDFSLTDGSIHWNTNRAIQGVQSIRMDTRNGSLHNQDISTVTGTTSIGCWFKSEEVSDNEYIFSLSSTGSTLALGLEYRTGGSIRVWHDGIPESYAPELHFRKTDWHHYGLVWDGTNVIFYLDGVAVLTHAYTDSDWTWDYVRYGAAGASVFGTEGEFDGMYLDSGAFTADEMWALAWDRQNIGSATSVFDLDCNPGAFTLTGFDVEFVYNGGATVYDLDCDPGSFALGGGNVDLLAERDLTGQSGSFTLDGGTTDLLATRVLDTTSGSFTLTGSDVTLSTTNVYVLNCDPGSFLLAGSNTDLLAERELTGQSGSFVLGAGTADLLREYVLDTTSGSFVLTGSDVTLATTNVYVLNCDPGAFILGGENANLLAERELDTQSGSFTLGGGTADLLKSYVLDTTSGSFLLTGGDAGLNLVDGLLLDTGTFTLTGFDVELIVNRVLQCQSGSFVLAGEDAAVNAERELDVSAGSFSFTGEDATIQAERYIIAETGAFSLGTSDATLLAERVLDLASGTFVLTGTDVVLFYGDNTAYFISIRDGSIQTPKATANIRVAKATGYIHVP